jgi:hypothetical protein
MTRSLRARNVFDPFQSHYSYNWRKFPGGLGDAIKALNHVLVDNDAFAF